MSPKSLARRSSALFCIGALIFSFSHSNAEPPKIRDVVTADDLVKRAAKNVNHNPLAKLDRREVPEGAVQDPTKENPIKDLIATSDFISFQGMSTLIPKRAILHVPKHSQSRIQWEKGSRLVVWPTFYRANRGWIKTMEVTRGQAQGKEPFDEKVVENLQKSSSLVVATFKGGPISVLPYKDPEAEPAEGAEEGAEGEKKPEQK